MLAPASTKAAPRALALLAVLLILTHGTWRLPPTGSTAGSALSRLPPQGGSAAGLPFANHSPLEGESQKRAGRRRLMRWGVDAGPPGYDAAATPLSLKPQPAVGATILK